MESRALSLLLGFPLLMCSARAGSTQAAPDVVPHAHHAPWDSAVASSREIQIGGATLQIDFAPGSLDLGQPAIVRWVQNAATAVTAYYGRFPVPRARILIVPADNRQGVLRGTTWGDVGGFPAFTRMVLGQHATEQDLTDDWMMTHELVHTAFPSLPDDEHWMEEGLSTYVEPVARVQAGFLTPEKIWGDMVRDMGKGEPKPGDEGLDRTHTWGRTYWGGAMFCLVADVKIREQTANRKGLQDALRAVVAAGGTIDKQWDLTRALAIGDQATGSSVLTDLYASNSHAPVNVDLDQLWQRLGVDPGQGKVNFEGQAPLSAIRQSITRPER